MRKAGATARAMLVRAAADAWGVPAGEITVERGVLRHSGSGRVGRFGEFAEAAALLPVPADVPLKDPSTFRLIGRDDGSIRRLDTPGKSNGTAKFTIDILEPGMLTGRRCATAALRRPGHCFRGCRGASRQRCRRRQAGPDRCRGLREGTWPALKGREQLRITWDESAAEKRGTEQILEEYRALARTTGAVAGAHGDAEAALARADQVIEAEYVFPYLAHAPMETLNGVLHFDGQGARARFGSQLQTFDQQAIAAVLGLPPERVEIETLLAGGSFGRRGQFDSHLAAELAQVAKALGPGRTVKLCGHARTTFAAVITVPCSSIG